MLILFPIQFLAPLAYTALRVCIAIIFIHLSVTHVKNRQSLAEVFTTPLFPFPSFIVWYLVSIELTIGILMFLGLFTQIAALLSMLLSLKCIVMHARFTHPLIPSRLFFTLLFFASLLLFITGAGAVAIDLPI